MESAVHRAAAWPVGFVRPPVGFVRPGILTARRGPPVGFVRPPVGFVRPAFSAAFRGTDAFRSTRST